ncbi:uncharacterized protein DDB_G0271670-like isoform X2 [Nasonia vitripennis]|uniref:Uncharacterized protein n=1 Tax=Nasonia vitripennis TaxID=7425 RepID=A0A7M7Q887_NASVI|nr:uncharacterized protein DDB_G0271670-like isoform X2 [Nasonia vitripennis]
MKFYNFSIDLNIILTCVTHWCMKCFQITFAALCVAVISAESSSVSSYSASPSNARDYEYSGASYHAGGNNKPAQYAAEAYITTGGGSAYAKSDSRYSVESSSSDSNDPRASATSSFYKTKYGNEAVINSLRPTAFHASSSSSSNSPSSSSSSSSGSSDQLNPSHYGSSDYSSGSSRPSSSSSSSGQSQYEGASSSAAAADYTAMAYGERSPSEHHHPHHHSHISGPVYSSAAAAELAAGVSTGPSGPTVYTREYSGSSGLGEYAHQGRPTSYSHGGPSSLSASEYPSPQHAHPQYHHHHHQPQHAAYTSDEYPSQPMHSAPAHPYKSYVMSSPSSYPPKYQSVFGALKSFFGGGSDAAPSATHASSYPSGPSYYSSPSMMHAAAAHHHPAPSPYSGMPSSAAMSSGGPGYYFGPGPSASNSIYSKSYPSMRFVSGYGSGAGVGSSPGSKIIVVRDSSGALHGPGYPSTSALIGSPSSYMTKSKLSAFAPAGPGHAYISSVSPSSLAYASGPPSSSYPGYSSSPSFSSSGHGGSTFLGYSA